MSFGMTPQAVPPIDGHHPVRTEFYMMEDVRTALVETNGKPASFAEEILEIDQGVFEGKVPLDFIEDETEFQI